MVVSSGCKKTITDSPGHAPSDHYFSVSGQRLEAVKAKRLKVLKLDTDGQLLKEHAVTEIIDVSGKPYFRLASSWQETEGLFVQGLNHFKFVYAETLSDDVKISVSLKGNNQIVYDAVVYNHQVIQPTITDKPSANSKHYTVTD